MSELQATIEFSVELCKFYNVDLFQRGLYQVRCGLRVPPKQPVQTEVSIPETGKSIGTASVLGNGGACRPFQILYRNEEVNLQDMILFRCHLLVDSRRLRESLERAEFALVIELWFSEQPHQQMIMVSTRTLQLNFSPVKGLHYHLPVLFDYFHLSAVSLTIHAVLVALHQPYINTPRSAKPWLGSSKFRTHTINNTSLESVFQSGTKCGGSSPNKFAQARLLHQNVCEVLLEAHQNLQAAFKELLLLLPQWQQIQNSQHRNATQRLKKLCDSAKLMDVEEDFTARANSDVAQLCAENIVQWQNFLTSVSAKAVIHQHLAKKHHSLRVRRFAEAFFVVDNPRHSAAGCYDANYQNYLAISDLARRSKYLVTLPPLPVHCVALDGDQTTMPIIFEDQYQDTLEFARRRSVAAGRKSGSDPFLSGKLSAESSPKPTVTADSEDCSCGIAQILESRSGSRTGMVSGGRQEHNPSSTRPPAALPARHSKSLDQLRVPGTGQFATMPTRGSDKHEDRKRRNERNGCDERQQQNNTMGGRRRLPYASRSTIDLALRRDLSPPQVTERPKSGGGERGRANSGGEQQRARSPRKHYEYQQYHPPRPLSEPQHTNSSAHFKHHHCRSSDESERRRLADRSDISPSGPGPGPGHINANCVQFPRSNSTQIFPPNRQELDIIFHHSTLILSRNKDRDRDREQRDSNRNDRPITPNYRSDPERRRRQLPQYHDGHGVPPGYGRTTTQHHRQSNSERNMNTFPRHGQSHNQSNRTGKFAATSKDEHLCPVKNSSISSRYKSSGSGGSREPIVTSSSTDSESLPNGAASHSHSSGSASKRLHSSASVPHHLARGADGLSPIVHRHVRSASSVLDEMFPLNPTASESLPNLAQPDIIPVAEHHIMTMGRRQRAPHQTHRRHFSGGAIGTTMLSMSMSLSTSASTSSLTSERSGWVSSHSVSEISSPEPHVVSTANTTPTGPPVNGEQLRSKLYELVSSQQQQPKDRNTTSKHKSKPNVPPGYGRTSADGPGLDSGSVDHQDIHNGQDVDSVDVDVTLALLDDGNDFIEKIYGYATTYGDETRNNGIVNTQLEHPYIKKEMPHTATTPDPVKDSTSAAGYEEVRLPPPKQFRDVPLPPEPFRDPSPGPGPQPIVSSTGSTTMGGTGPSPAIDNLLYHVYESIQDDIKKSKSNTDLADKIEDFLATEEIQQQKLPTDEVHQLFAKARNEFKSQLNFSGILYSDLPSFASTLPYFHISDEYRIFSPEGMHLIVCVHGLDGNSADLRLVKTYLELGLPGSHLEFLMSERNQGDTFSDFDTMTDRLVGEILYHMESCGMRPTRISFVGHSLGNIIIRSALTRPQMKPLLSRLHTFLSLSGPHLGTLYNSSGLVNMGMWFMQKWKKSGSLLQLCLRDATDVRQSFLYRLSQRSTLHHFKNVLLCGSSQDRYVPLHSARLELCKAAIRDTTALGSAYREMVHNVVSPMLARRELTLVRYDVHHALPHTANALIGRAAHIAVLDSELFIEKFLVVAGLKYFR